MSLLLIVFGVLTALPFAVAMVGMSRPLRGKPIAFERAWLPKIPSRHPDMIARTSP